MLHTQRMSRKELSVRRSRIPRSRYHVMRVRRGYGMVRLLVGVLVCVS